MGDLTDGRAGKYEMHVPQELYGRDGHTRMSAFARLMRRARGLPATGYGAAAARRAEFSQLQQLKLICSILEGPVTAVPSCAGVLLCSCVLGVG